MGWIAALVLVLLAVVLCAAPFYVYGRFNAEQPIAELSFKQLGPQRYRAYLATGNLCDVKSYDLLGDQWQLDASFLKWKGIGTLLGLQSLYRLDRLSGRYASVDEQNSREKQSYDIAPKVLVSLFPKTNEKGFSGLLVDTHFGSSVYLDIDVSKKYRVYKTEDALVAKAVDAPAGGNQQEVTVVIDKACGGKPGLIQKLVTAANALAVGVL
ncbi:MAG: hypothetical protein U1F34_02840 [Gammaproteobacteria bacterium]